MRNKYLKSTNLGPALTFACCRSCLGWEKIKRKQKQKENEKGQSWKSIQGRRWCGRSPICFSRCTCSRRCRPSMVSRTREGWTKGQGTVSLWSNRSNEKWTMDLFGYKPSFWPFLIQFCYTRLCLPRNEGNIETALEMMAVFVANPG